MTFVCLFEVEVPELIIKVARKSAKVARVAKEAVKGATD